MATPTPSVRIPTDSLIKLLLDSPETKLELESMACEKVAQELARKLLNGQLSDFEKKVTEEVAKLLKTSSANLSTARVSLGARAQQLVEDEVRLLARRYVTDHAEDLQQAAVATLEASMVKSVQAIVDQLRATQSQFWTDLRAWSEKHNAELTEQVKVTARTEFLDVLREAKEATRAITNDIVRGTNV